MSAWMTYGLWTAIVFYTLYDLVVILCIPMIVFLVVMEIRHRWNKPSYARRGIDRIDRAVMTVTVVAIIVLLAIAIFFTPRVIELWR